MKKETMAKAVIGGVLAALGATQVALADGHVSATEWITVAIAAITVAGGVFGVTNRPKE